MAFSLILSWSERLKHAREVLRSGHVWQNWSKPALDRVLNNKLKLQQSSLWWPPTCRPSRPRFLTQYSKLLQRQWKPRHSVHHQSVANVVNASLAEITQGTPPRSGNVVALAEPGLDSQAPKQFFSAWLFLSAVGWVPKSRPKSGLTNILILELSSRFLPIIKIIIPLLCHFTI